MICVAFCFYILSNPYNHMLMKAAIWLFPNLDSNRRVSTTEFNSH